MERRLLREGLAERRDHDALMKDSWKCSDSVTSVSGKGWQRWAATASSQGLAPIMSTSWM